MKSPRETEVPSSDEPTIVASTSLGRGAVLAGKYEVERVLGEGGPASARGARGSSRSRHRPPRSEAGQPLSDPSARRLPVRQGAGFRAPDHQQKSLTRSTSGALGSPLYMAPEQVRSAKNASFPRWLSCAARSFDSNVVWNAHTDDPDALLPTYCQARREVDTWIRHHEDGALAILLEAVGDGEAFEDVYGEMMTQ